MKSKILKKFFFTSRRRHTRWPRDWSSVVCSSDLLSYATRERQSLSEDPGRYLTQRARALRSEERRVGKECRIWVLSHSYKVKRISLLERKRLKRDELH